MLIGKAHSLEYVFNFFPSVRFSYFIFYYMLSIDFNLLHITTQIMLHCFWGAMPSVWWKVIEWVLYPKLFRYIWALCVWIKLVYKFFPRGSSVDTVRTIINLSIQFLQFFHQWLSFPLRWPEDVLVRRGCKTKGKAQVWLNIPLLASSSDHLWKQISRTE